MINVEQVHAIVGDSSGDSVQVNRLNYDTTGMTIRKVPTDVLPMFVRFLQ